MLLGSLLQSVLGQGRGLLCVARQSVAVSVGTGQGFVVCCSAVCCSQCGGREGVCCVLLGSLLRSVLGQGRGLLCVARQSVVVSAGTGKGFAVCCSAVCCNQCEDREGVCCVLLGSLLMSVWGWGRGLLCIAQQPVAVSVGTGKGFCVFL